MTDRDRPGPALAKWGEAVAAYSRARATHSRRYGRANSRHPPWPHTDDPMMGYLAAQAMEIGEEAGLEEALVWLAVHGWFEGALDERARMLRALTA